MNTMILMKQHIVRMMLLCIVMMCGVGSVWADEWSINFAEIGQRNSLTDKYAATISAEVAGGMGTVTLGEPLNPNFGIQTETTWLYRTAQKALYQGNGGGRNFGVFNAVAKQIITLDITAAPTPTNATLRNTNGNIRTYEVVADGTVTFNLARYEYIYSISVANPSATEVDYTLRYVDEGGNELKTSIKSGTPGESVSLLDADKENFWIAENKYIYVSDDAAGKTIAEDGTTVVTLTYRLVTTRYSYTVKSNVGNIIFADASVLETESVTVPYPEHILTGSTLYTVPQLKMTADDYYRVTFTPDHDNYEVTVPYDGAQIRNVVFYTEGEDIAGVTTATNATRASKGQMGYTANADTYLPVTELRQGVYQIYIRGVNGNTTARTVNFKAGDRIVYTDQIPNGTGIRKNSGDVYIGETSTLSFACEGSSASGLDNMYIVRIGDFEPTPVFTKNLRADDGAIAGVEKTLSVHADNTDTYTWYESATEDGEDTVVQAAKSAEEGGNRYIFTREENASDIYLYCIATGYSGVETKSVVAKITTVNESVPGAFVTGYTQDYESEATVDWHSQNASVSIENHDGSNMLAINGENANGARTAYMPLTDNLRYMTPDHVTNDWGLEFDFYPVNNDFTPTDQALQIYKEGTIIGTTGQTAGNNMPLELNDCFITFDCNNTNNLYGISIAGVSQSGNITLTPGAKYHVSIKILESTMTRAAGGQMTVNIKDASGNPVYSYEGTSPFDTENLLGGIMYVMPRRNIKTAHAYFDNIALKVKTTDLAISSDIAEFYEGNDDYYLEDGAGLNFDVPAATTFKWYVSSVAPKADADGTTEPKLNSDGSVTWDEGTAYMEVTSPVGRASTTIQKINGQTLSAAGLHAVAPAADNEGKYAYNHLSGYLDDHVVTVYDAARVDNTTATAIFRYDDAPEATVSGSRWHYLRQLKSGESEQHMDYVWCVASNPLGKVTSKVAQIITYPLASQISLSDNYVTVDQDGDRADLTLPGIYKFRSMKVEISASNLIFNTANMPVPYDTKSIIQYKDASSNIYAPNTDLIGPSTTWKHEETVWPGVISTTNFTGLDPILEANASVHGFYKDIRINVPITFNYGLMQIWNMAEYDAVTHGAAEYVIGPKDNTALQAVQDIHFDYGRRPVTPLGSVSVQTTWDWSKLPERGFLTYNTTKYTKPEDIDKYLYTVPRTSPAETYVIDPGTGLGGPKMGEEYVMADFYGYSTSELGGFSSDKVALGLEYVNEPTDHCMQGNAFIIKPTLPGTLVVEFSSTDGNQKRYLALCTRTDISSTDILHDDDAFSETFSEGNNDHKTITMTITSDMVGGDKVIVLRARNRIGEEDNGATNQYFRIYTANYTPDASSVTAKEYVADDKTDILAADTYTEVETPAFDGNHFGNTDGFVSLHAAAGAKIRYKLYVGNETVDDIFAAITSPAASDLKTAINALETYDYAPETYTDTKGNKIGIHVRVNSKIIAWAEMPGMNNSQPLVYETHAATYPVDLRFMYNFTDKPEPTADRTTQDNFFNNTYWGTGGDVKTRETATAPKAWNTTTKFRVGDVEYSAADFADVEIDGVPYTAENFDRFYITHGTVIDINVMAKAVFQFDGFGAPAVGKVGGDGADKDYYTINDMMRARAATKYARYHLLYDKAKAKNTDYIAFLIANFKDLEGVFTANIVMKEGTDAATDPTYTSSVIVNDENQIVAPRYHSAHDSEGLTVVMWTEDHSARDGNNIVTSPDTETFTNYLPGETTKIYENTFIKPVYRENTIADNYHSRSADMHAEWWFTTDHYAQPLEVHNEYPGFSMPYVTPVRRHEIGTAVADAEDDLWFDLPMTITPGSTGRVHNTSIPEWCSVGRGTKFTLPACPGAEITMEVRSKMSLTDGGTTFGGAYPVLWKVKYMDDAAYYETDTPDPGKTIESYIYKYVCPADWTSGDLDIVLGNDYSYLRRIGLMMPVINNNRDAALITLNFSELMEHLDLMSLMGYDDFSEKLAPKPYNDGRTGDGYDFDHKSQNIFLYKTHYSKEHGAIYYDGVSSFQVSSVADNVPYVNGTSGFTFSTGEYAQGEKIAQTPADGSGKKGTFIVGPFRSITHIRFQQGCSVIGGGGWYMTVGRMPVSDSWKNYKYHDGYINDPNDPRRTIPEFSSIQWSDAKYGSIHNSTTPEWVEIDIEEHIYPKGSNKDDVSLIEQSGYDEMPGDIWLRFQADKPDVYLFGFEIYGIDPAPEQQVILETGILAAQKDDDTTFEPSSRAGTIFHFPYLLQLDEKYKPVSSVKSSEDKFMQYNEGREVTLTANANLGYTFLKWVKPDGNGGWEDVSTENPYRFNIEIDTELRAVFVHRGVINYITSGTNYGHAPEIQQTDQRGGFVVADNRGMFSAEGMSLRQWQDSEPLHEWYEGEGKGVSSVFGVSTNHVNDALTGNETTKSEVKRSRAETGIQVDVFPQFTANTLSPLDVTGRKGVTVRWQFGKKNGAPSMIGNGGTAHLVTQMAIATTEDVVNAETGEVSTIPVNDTIDVKMDVNAAINNAGRADAYATVGGTGTPGESFATFTLPATKGMKVEIGAADNIRYRVNGGEWKDYTGPFPFYSPLTSAKIEICDKTDDTKGVELEYIQATYYQRAQTPVLSIQNVDVIGDDATNNVQVQVQTNSNKNAIRLYTTDGSDPQYELIGNEIRTVGTTRQVRSNYITINETQIGSGTTLKVLSVCPDRADSKIATLDLEKYDNSLGLATYVYDSRFINIHEDQIFQKLMADHKGHFNLLSYDLNPAAAVIPAVITDHTTVFVTSDAVRPHLVQALTNPSDPAAHNQTFKVEPLIVGTPLTVSWKQSAAEGDWIPITCQNGNPKENPETPTSPATTTYTEIMRAMKNAATRVDPSQTYAEFYADQIAANDGNYILSFYDNMLLDNNSVCISNTTSLAPEYLSHNGVQLVFNATELLTRKTGNSFADVRTFERMLRTLMAPTRNPQLIDIAMTYTQDVIDRIPEKEWITLDAPMLSALSDGKSEMSMSYLAASYPQFKAGTAHSSPNESYGNVVVQNVEVATDSDDLATAEKLGAQGVKDLATIITLTNPDDLTFKREYRIEYNVPLEEITFHKDGDKWVNDEGNELSTIVEAKDKDGHPTFKFTGPQNFGIKNVCFNGYALAPDVNFDANGEIRQDINPDGTPMYSIWGRGEKFNEDDVIPSPTAYNVIEPMIPEFKVSSAVGERYDLPEGQWMVSEFPWGFKDCNRMAFTLLNITEYVGKIKVQYYHRQAESPKLLSAYMGKENEEEYRLRDDIEVDPSGEIRLEFNSVMHQVRKPGHYIDLDVDWTVHIIPDELAPGVTYTEIKNNSREIDKYDKQDIQQMLTADGGSNMLTFHYWRLEEGKKYWLHIPFHILRGAVGSGTPYTLPDGYGTPGFEGPEKGMGYTDYVGTDGKKVPYFDIPFTVKQKNRKHQQFNYIVSKDSWWDAYKEAGSQTCADALPYYAQWDGDFTTGINNINALEEGHDRYYMHIQKDKDEAYTYDGTDEFGHQGLIQMKTSDFSIIGEGCDSTVITAKPEIFSDAYSGLDENNNESTLHLDGSKIYIQDLTLRNEQKGIDADGQEYPALFDHGDRNIYYGVNIDGFEESFAVFGTLSYLEKCRISGYGDFIVGSGDVWLNSCNIVLRNKLNINLCAPSTKATNKWGFVFYDCNIDREEGAGLVLDHNWTLARPWEGYDTEVLKSPSVNFINTDFHVLPTQGGYGSLSDGLRLRFHEYGSMQGGQFLPLTTRSIANCNPDASSDYPVITAEQAEAYTIENVFGRGTSNGYDPQALAMQAKAPVLVNDGMVLHWKADASDLCYLVYYLGDDKEPDWQNAMMFCCVPGTDEEEAYCYLTDHDRSPIFRTGGTDKPIAFSEMWYGYRKVNGSDEGYNTDDKIPGMGKDSPSRLWFAVRAANQMGGLSPMSNALKYYAARQYRTTITDKSKRKDDESGNAFSTIYLDFQARAPKGVKVYALTDIGVTDTISTETTLTFTRVSDSQDPEHQDVLYANQGYLIYGSYGEGIKNHIFIETTTPPEKEHTSYLTGTAGVFKNEISEAGYGELDGVNGETGWSISSEDYDNVPRVNTFAYTLQKYDDILGFYNFSGSHFAHHRAYLDADKARDILMTKEGLSAEEAQGHLSKGIRIHIKDGNDEGVGIHQVTVPTKDVIYDLMGRRIDSRHMRIGNVYIINGRKVLWK